MKEKVAIEGQDGGEGDEREGAYLKFEDGDISRNVIEDAKSRKTCPSSLNVLKLFLCLCVMILLDQPTELEEKPAAAMRSNFAAASEIEMALRSNQSISTVSRPIWAVGENYRFEPAFVESRKLVNEMGKMLSFQVVIEGSMNSSNPYFSSSWRRNFAVTFAGCEVTRVSASTSHVDTTLPPPDSISSLFLGTLRLRVWNNFLLSELENGCFGVFVMVVLSPSPKIFWRIVGLKGLCDVAVLKAMLESGAKGGCQVDVKRL
ncbi:hypothetical protein RJ641_007404 [Dillenia turbinata]|uniref:Uncharacterized protein n=1 Tax=Dillenia turbinata TaxID=194707 RepID=A0AAN8V1C3_9MAGN